MRPKLLLLGVFVVCVAFAIDRTMAEFDDSIDIDGDTDSSEKKESESTKTVKIFDGEGDDDEDDDGSTTVSDESASGSGDPIDAIVDVTVVSPSTKQPDTTTEQTTENPNVIADSTQNPSEDPLVDERPDGPSDNGESVAYGGVSDTDDDEPSEEDTDEDEQDTPNAEARTKEKEGSVLRVLTTEVIAAVVVGAVCAVILIAFLVYRLRKRDEGSYALSDACYKDTYKLQGDTGKEAFV